MHAHEHGRTQSLSFDVEIELEPILDDTIASTLDYDRVVDLIERTLADGHIQLVETVARRIVEALGTFPMVRYAEVRVTKPSALSKARAAGAIWAATFNARDVQGQMTTKPGEIQAEAISEPASMSKPSSQPSRIVIQGLS